MRHSRWTHALSWVGSTALAAACASAEVDDFPHAAGPAAPEQPTPAPTPPAPPSPQPEIDAPPTLRKPEGEPAYFAFDEQLVQLDAQGFDAIALDEKFWGLQRAPDGSLRAFTFDRVLALTDGAFVPITARMEEGISNVHLVADDDIWATQMTALLHWDGSAWRHEPLAALDALATDFSIELTPQSVVVDADARVWLSTYRDIMVRDAEKHWHVLRRATLGGRPKQLWLDEDGAARLQLESERFVGLPADPSAAPTRAGAPRNSAWLEPHGDRWLVAHEGPTGRGPARTLGREIDGVMATSTVADARGRLWVATAEGVSIFDGADVVRWPMGTVPALAARVHEIMVLGSGPETLPPAGPLQTGGVRGRLVGDGIVTAGATLELCAHTLAITIPPCTRSRLRYTATADADGVFAIDEIPIGAYGLSVTVDARHQQWRIVHRGAEPFRITADAVNELGDLDASRGALARDDRKGSR